MRGQVADPAVLRLENLGKRYSPDRPALFERLELELRQGEYIAVMGESGVGKSTLLNLLAGLDQPAPQMGFGESVDEAAIAAVGAGLPVSRAGRNDDLLPASALLERDRDGDDQYAILNHFAGSGRFAHAALP